MKGATKKTATSKIAHSLPPSLAHSPPTPDPRLEGWLPVGEGSDEEDRNQPDHRGHLDEPVDLKR